MKKFAFVFLVAALVVLAAMPLAGQTQTGRLEGVVRDAQNAVIPNAKVTAVHVQTGATSETTTNNQGLYVFAAVGIGTYNVSVEANGFRKLVHAGVAMDVGATVSEDFALTVGAVTESVTVEANALHVQTQESYIGRAVTTKEVDTLPALGRTPVILAVFQPGVQMSTPGDPTYSHINGLRQGSNNSSLDGIDVNDSVAPRMGLTMTANNTDSIEEVRMITNGAKAEYGRNAGGQVELITRSGTNTYHGNLFDYLRNTDLNANDFFNNLSYSAAQPLGVPRPILIQNNFGGSFGGKIKRDKLFFFFNIQDIETHATISRERTVLTDSAKAGIFQWQTTPTSPISSFNIPTNDPRKLGIDPTVKGLLALTPSPNAFDTGDLLNTAGFRFNNPNNSYSRQITSKFDYNLTSTNHVFFRYSRQTNSAIDSLNSADAPFPGGVQGSQGGERWGLVGGDDWTLSPHMVNEFRYGYQSATADFVRPERLSGPQVIPNLYTNPILSAFAQGRNSPVNEFTDNMTYQKGVHTIKWGYNSRWTDQYGYNNAGIYPNVSLSTANGNSVPTTFGPGAAGQAAIASADLSRYQSLYNDLLGRVSSVTQTYYSDLSKFQAAGSSLIRNYLLREYGLFVQDDWRVRPNLTVNVGLRWEYFKPPVERDDFQGYLNKAGSVNTASNIDNLTVVKGQQWYNSDFKDFAPRLGFAWDPTGKGKTSIRGDFGIFYDRMIGAAVSLADGNTPGFSSPLTNYPNQTGTDVRVSDGVNAMVPALPAAPVLQLPANRGNAAGVLFNPNLTTGYVTHMSLGIQREVFRNTVLDVSYVGTRGIKLFMDEDMNQQKIYTSGFLSAFQQLQTACVGKTSCSALTAANPIVAVFGTAQSAYNSFGGTNVAQGAVYSAATTMDVNNYTKYAAAGLSEYYLRNYPQFQQLIEGTNDGRTYYNSLQVSVRRNVGALKMVANYTWSKSMDNWNSEGNGFTNSTVMDNYNLALNRGRADSDIPQAFNAATTYTLPIGKGHRFGTNWNRWLDTAFGGWDVGNLTVWQSGRTMTLTAGVNSGPFGANWANYTGDRNTGGVLRQGSGVFYFTPGQITAFTATTSFNGVSIPALLPAAGQVGSAGRNTFRGPRYFDMDFSLVKAFKLTERQRVTFRIESYDAFNNVNFNNPAFTATTAAATFGKITTDIASRVYQMALRYDF